jgi:hypothetical protein
VKKLILVAAGALVTGSAVAALGMGSSNADPSTAGGTLNVLGEPYYKAVAILRAQGVQTVFGGSVGSDMPQAKCVVSTQKYLNSGKMQLMLNCTEEAQPDEPTATSVATAPTEGTSDGGGTRPTPGAPGVVTVTPTQVG